MLASAQQLAWLAALVRCAVLASCVNCQPSAHTSMSCVLTGVLQSMGELDGILTFCEVAVPLVSRLAERFGLPGNTPDSVDAARDKHSTRAVMQARPCLDPICLRCAFLAAHPPLTSA